MNAQEARRNGLAQDGVKQTHQRDDHKYWPDDAQRKAERACRPNTRKVQDIVQCIDATCLRWSVSSRPAHHEAAGFRVAEFRNFCRVPDAMLDSENRTLLWDQAKSWILVTRTPLVWRTDRLYDRWGWLRLYLSSITACGSNEPEPHPWYFTLLVRALSGSMGGPFGSLETSRNARPVSRRRRRRVFGAYRAPTTRYWKRPC